MTKLELDNLAALIKFAIREGLTGILVLTGYGKGLMAYHAHEWECKPHHIADDLHAAVCWILEKEKQGYELQVRDRVDGKTGKG